jgi:hypothetical protein
MNAFSPAKSFLGRIELGVIHHGPVGTYGFGKGNKDKSYSAIT